jgi:hypothetical protein
MSWAQRLKCVFGIEIERCEQCGGALKIIGSMNTMLQDQIQLVVLPMRCETPPYRACFGAAGVIVPMNRKIFSLCWSLPAIRAAAKVRLVVECRTAAIPNQVLRRKSARTKSSTKTMTCHYSPPTSVTPIPLQRY